MKINISEIYFRINDYGKGFDVNKEYNGHFGLKNLKERVELLNGTLNIEYTDKEGSIFEITIPNIKSETKVVPELF